MGVEDKPTTMAPPSQQKEFTWAKAGLILLTAFVTLSASLVTFEYQFRANRSQALTEKRYSELKDLTLSFSKQTALVRTLAEQKAKIGLLTRQNRISRREYAEIYGSYWAATQDLQSWIGDYTFRSRLVSKLLGVSLPEAGKVELFVDGLATDEGITISEGEMLRRISRVSDSCMNQLGAITELNNSFLARFPDALSATIR